MGGTWVTWVERPGWNLGESDETWGGDNDTIPSLKIGSFYQATISGLCYG